MEGDKETNKKTLILHRDVYCRMNAMFLFCDVLAIVVVVMNPN
jgi:hypothetical protein